MRACVLVWVYVCYKDVKSGKCSVVFAGVGGSGVGALLSQSEHWQTGRSEVSCTQVDEQWSGWRLRQLTTY